MQKPSQKQKISGTHTRRGRRKAHTRSDTHAWQKHREDEREEKYIASNQKTNGDQRSVSSTEMTHGPQEKKNAEVLFSYGNKKTLPCLPMETQADC